MNPISLTFASLVVLAAASPAAAEGYWKLDRKEFSTDTGTLEWLGQGGETNIRLLSHERSSFVFHESWRTSMTQTYTINWSVPDSLIPGDAAPFLISETCNESTISAGWPFSNTKMGPASLVSDFNTNSYQQIADTPCTLDATVSAPTLPWTIPAGKLGDTTKVVISVAPTNTHPAIERYFYTFVAGAPPARTNANTGVSPTPQNGINPAGHHTVPLTGATSPAGATSTWRVPPGNTGTEALTAPAEPVLYRNGADGNVSLGITRPTQFNANAPFLLSQVMTYHYGFRGHPGTIALQHQDGTVYGPWPAAGAGSAALPNVYWWVRPNIVLKAGLYTVIDSDPGSWSVEAATNGAGIVQIWGRLP